MVSNHGHAEEKLTQEIVSARNPQWWHLFGPGNMPRQPTGTKCALNWQECNDLLDDPSQLAAIGKMGQALSVDSLVRLRQSEEAFCFKNSTVGFCF